MAVISDRTASRLTLQLQTGTDPLGQPTVKNKTYNNIKPTATDENVFAVANALASLQTLPLYGIGRLNTYALEEE